VVELGGSAVNNLNDNLLLFGLQPGANNNFALPTPSSVTLPRSNTGTLQGRQQDPDVKEFSILLMFSSVFDALAERRKPTSPASVPAGIPARSFETRLEHRVCHGQVPSPPKANARCTRSRTTGHCRRPLVTLNGHTDNTGPRRKHGFGGAARSGRQGLVAEKSSSNFPTAVSASCLRRLQAPRVERHRGWPAKNRRVEIILSARIGARVNPMKPAAATMGTNAAPRKSAAAAGHVNIWHDILGAFSPNRVISKAALRFIIVFQIAVLLCLGHSSYVFLPKRWTCAGLRGPLEPRGWARNLSSVSL